MTDDLLVRLAQLESRLSAVEDKEAIRQQLYAYARGVDRCDRSLIAGAYHESARDDHGTFRGTRDEIVEIIAANRSGAMNSQHHIGNVLIELAGDEARVETYFVACHTRTVDGVPWTRFRAGRYLDQWRREAGRWGISHRRVVEDWARLDRVTEVPAEIGEQCIWGSRTGEDPSYALSDFVGYGVGRQT